jgi:hypothetical protein
MKVESQLLVGRYALLNEARQGEEILGRGWQKEKK